MKTCEQAWRTHAARGRDCISNVAEQIAMIDPLLGGLLNFAGLGCGSTVERAEGFRWLCTGAWTHQLAITVDETDCLGDVIQAHGHILLPACQG